MFQFPLEVKAALTLFITQGIKSVLALAGVDVSGWLALVVAAAVTAFLLFAESLVGSLSPAIQQIVVALLTLLTAAGGYATLKWFKK